MNPFIQMLRARDVLRSPEDEGAGGAGHSPEGGSPAPDTDSRFGAMEERLGQMSKIMTEFMGAQRAQASRSQIQQFETDLKGRVTAAEANVTKAEADLAEALDAGEGTAIARAQRVLTEAVSKLDRAKQNVETFDQRRKEEERRSGGATGNDDGGAQQQQLSTANLDAWKQRHRSWYGIDTEMTRDAMAISDRIRNAGAIPVGSKEYFAVIDRELKNKYPDRLGGAPETAGGGGGQAPGAGTARRGRVHQSVLDGWRRMGIDVSDPKVVDRMLSHRQTAVNKGILPETPINAPVMSR